MKKKILEKKELKKLIKGLEELDKDLERLIQKLKDSKNIKK